MSFEDKDLLAAINHTKHGYIVPSLSTSGTEWIAGMMPVEQHAEVVYAESLYQKSLLGIVYSSNWLVFIREVLNMCTTISIYCQLRKWIETVDATYATAHPELLAAISPPNSTPAGSETDTEDRHSQSSATSFASANSSFATPSMSSFPNHTSTQQLTTDPPSTPSPSHPYLPDPSIDMHFRTGVYLGLGMLHLVLSMMPGKLLVLVDLFGYKGDSKLGLELLEWAGGWGNGSRVVDKETEGVQHPICDKSLLIFHLVLSAFMFEGVDVCKAARVLEWNLKRYHNGIFFLFGASRLALVRSQPTKVLDYYTCAAQAQSQYWNLHHISW
ncbi:outer membrane protein Iml2/Tetratricopeptide repeat protein 39 [Suillus paluster]|uniref:outer membrane protein Iml2/Tetratricopeptide repeat protein 39 n=1 Tax=Suillus paluster TaxID=48578 RepID=UPI001B87E889|nr:outer membrane protein Iml2/Tetratricopeptide repeat protein 39 [Suillus paluster]KAG1729945.1 outer membrane protein Iml2/Tetratricopeptide repeat protein 39 [Suillus paluster]